MKPSLHCFISLGITQIVIGSLTLLVGIIAAAIMNHFWVNRSGAGIWGGLWILVTGVLGVFSASHPSNGCLNGVHMAFNIITTCLSFIDGIMFVVGLGYGFYKCS